MNLILADKLILGGYFGIFIVICCACALVYIIWESINKNKDDKR